MSALPVPIKLLRPGAKVPARAKEGDAGYDLCSIEGLAIPALSRAVVNTGIAVAIPLGHYGRIAPRSGLAVKAGIDVLAGVLDSGFRGPVGVVLFNTDRESPFLIRPGDRVAQLIIERCEEAAFTVVDQLPESQRGASGFGSTGTA